MEALEQHSRWNSEGENYWRSRERRGTLHDAGEISDNRRSAGVSAQGGCRVANMLLGRAREALEVELPALPQVSDADLSAPLAALLSRWPVADG